MAEKTNMTKRTIDHYTNLGLLIAERSDSNYRFYDETAIQLLQEIEAWKKEGMTLFEIKKLIREKEAAIIDLIDLRMKMKALEHDIANILRVLNEDCSGNTEYVRKSVSKESMSLVQGLMKLQK